MVLLFQFLVVLSVYLLLWYKPVMWYIMFWCIDELEKGEKIEFWDEKGSEQPIIDKGGFLMWYFAVSMQVYFHVGFNEIAASCIARQVRIF